jgi:hypothetical protein
MTLADMARISGVPCSAGQGPRSLTRLQERLLGPNGGSLVVVPEAVTGAIHLPGRIIVIGRDLVEDFEGPEVAAGFILAERLRAETSDPLEALLHWVGLRGSFRLLTTGDLTRDSIAGYGETLLAAEPVPVPDTTEP